MHALNRFNPFRSAGRFDVPPAFDELFRSFGPRLPWEQIGLATDMRVDITEDESAYQIQAELPGVDKDDIDVAVEGNRVSITAEARREEEQRGRKELMIERSWGRTFRTFTLPTDVDATHTQARYEKGVLLLTLPKRANGNAQRIAVT